MLTLAIPLAVMLVGAFMYFVTNSKWSELGRIAFFCGLLILLFTVAGRQIHINM